MGIQAQQEGAIWYFGDNAGLDFRSGTPVPLTNGEHYIFEGCATISTPDGNLLLYSDGLNIWNRNNQIMPNGEGLLGDSSSSQSAIIVPHPGNIDQYYVFTVNANYHFIRADGLNYTLVDLTLDGGNGDVVPGQKNIELLSLTEEKLTAVKKSDTEYLIITRFYDTFYTYKIDTFGLNPVPIITTIGPPVAGAQDDFFGINSSIGYMKFSPDGTKLAMAVMDMLYPFANYTLGLGGVILFDFDLNTGRPTNPRLLSDFFRPYGLEFSPDSSKLYISTGFDQLIPSDPSGLIYQFDLESPDIPASRSAVLEMPYAYYTGALQLGIDGKIYFTTFRDTEAFRYIGDWSEYMSVIQNPNEAAANLNIDLDVLYLSGNQGRYGLPTFISSFFNIGLVYQNTCFSDSTEFSSNSTDPIVSIVWDFGDGNTSNVEDPSHTYAAPGTYTVSVTVTTASETKTESKEVTIYGVPVANPATDYEVCSIDPAYGFDLSTKDTEVLGAQPATDYIVAYYPSLADAQVGTNPLPTMYTNTDPVETIFVRISNNGNTACYDITSFDLVVKHAPALHPVTDWTVCDTDTDGLFAFDLSTKDNQVLDGQDPADFSVSYHTTQTDADNALNPIGPNHTNTATPETIYFRIGNATYPECYETGSFNLEVIDQVTAYTPQDLDHCDDDNDGQAVFDLTITEAEIIGSQNPAGLVLSYHESQADADTGSNALTPSYLSTAYQNTIYVRVANTSDANCYDTTSFQLNIFDTPVLPEVSNWQVCDDDNDGRYTFDLTEKANEILAGTTATSVSFYESQADADNAINALGATYQNTANPQTLYFRMENTNNPDCYATGTFQLQVFDTPTAHVPEPLIVCDTEGTGILALDLSIKDTEVLDGQDPDDFTVTYFATQTDAEANVNALTKSAYTNTAARETLHARIQNNENEDCHDVTSFEFIINLRPELQLEETYVICPESPELNLDGGDFESWSWRNGNGREIGAGRILDITELGGYSLTVIEIRNGITCEGTVSFEVVSSGAPDDFSTEIIGFGDRVTIAVTATGIGEFEYSVDGENYQDSNRLEVFPGEYTVYVRDKFLCRTLKKEIIALGYQKFFTPNGDGSHEHWNVIGAEAYPGSRLHIYDRYGKLVAQVLPDGPGWDGTFKGVAMPSSDYWFRYELEEGRSFTGHFTLKR